MTEQTIRDINTQRGIQPGEVPVNASVGECEHASVSVNMLVWVSEHAGVGECEHADVNEREEHAKERSHAPKV